MSQGELFSKKNTVKKRKTTKKKVVKKKVVKKKVTAKRKTPIKKPLKKKTKGKKKTIKRVTLYETINDYVIYINHNGKRFFYDGNQLDDVKANAKGYKKSSATMKTDAQKVANATGKKVFGDTRKRKIKKKH